MSGATDVWRIALLDPCQDDLVARVHLGFVVADVVDCGLHLS